MEEEGEGLPVHEICTSTQIRRRAFYNWWNRYRLSGSEGLNLKEYPTVHRTPPEIQRRHRRERHLATRPRHPRIRETTRDPHPSWIAILERTERRVKLRHILREEQDQAYPRWNRQTHNAQKDRSRRLIELHGPECGPR